jgi:hypothetical protein
LTDDSLLGYSGSQLKVGGSKLRVEGSRLRVEGSRLKASQPPVDDLTERIKSPPP